MPGELARMASIWRIDGVFWTCALKKRGQVLLVHEGSIVCSIGLDTRHAEYQRWRYEKVVVIRALHTFRKVVIVFGMLLCHCVGISF